MKSFKYSTQTINKRDIANVSKVLKSEFLTQGPKTIEFENKIKLLVKKIDQKSHILIKNFNILDQNLRFFIEKIFFHLHFVFLKAHQICSILTKYEGITPKTPKVRLIFDQICDVQKKDNFLYLK